MCRTQTECGVVVTWIGWLGAPRNPFCGPLYVDVLCTANCLQFAVAATFRKKLGLRTCVARPEVTARTERVAPHIKLRTARWERFGWPQRNNQTARLFIAMRLLLLLFAVLTPQNHAPIQGTAFFR